jgi:serine palmitoyltransferase
MQDLERILRESITEGQTPGSKYTPWTKILILIEGIYSMEGQISNLPEIVALKNKYKTYLYVDEAHSIGALGPTGRGVCEYWGINPAEVTILMGTFTKSFGSVGGYIASSKEIISYLRQCSYGPKCCISMSPACCQQTLSALKVISGEDGTDIGKKKIAQLRDNSNYFREQLRERGFKVFGDKDSPIVPMMVYHLGKMTGFSRECLKRNIAVVSVSYPATPLLLCRARFCISASHTREDLDWCINEIDEIGDKLMLKYCPAKRTQISLEPPVRPANAINFPTPPATTNLPITKKDRSLILKKKLEWRYGWGYLVLIWRCIEVIRQSAVLITIGEHSVNSDNVFNYRLEEIHPIFPPLKQMS